MSSIQKTILPPVNQEELQLHRRQYWEYHTQLHSLFPSHDLSTDLIFPKHRNIAPLVMEYLGATEEDSKLQVINDIENDIEIVFEPIHQLFERIIRCENEMEEKAGWKKTAYNVLDKRIEALQSGKTLLLNYLKTHLYPFLRKNTDPTDLIMLTATAPLEELIDISDVEAVLKALNVDAEIAGPLQARIKEIRGNEEEGLVQVPFEEFLKLCEKMYGITIYELMDLIHEEVSQHLLPNLHDPKKFLSELGILANRMVLFVTKGVKGFKADRASIEGKEYDVLLKLPKDLKLLKDYLPEVFNFIDTVLSTFLTASPESNYDLTMNLIERAIPMMVEKLEEDYSKEEIRTKWIPHIKAVREIVQKYCEGLLYTLLSGLKKTRPWTMLTYNSHFHGKFQECLLQPVCKYVVEDLKERIKQTRKGSLQPLSLYRQIALKVKDVCDSLFK